MQEITLSAKIGYLDVDFKLFHICDKNTQEFDFHYHDFDKIIIFLSGNVSYIVEGKTYLLKPWDILLVNHHHVHKPVIDPNVVYDRIVIWINSDFIKNHSKPGYDLETCFNLADRRSINMIRIDASLHSYFRRILDELEQALTSDEFASPLLANTIFIQFIIYLNRIMLKSSDKTSLDAYKSNRRIDEILQYINTHLGDDLSTDTLAANFYLSRSYLMHCFKKETGYALHVYIQQKRLLLAADLIRGEVPVTEACFQCGFNDYSSFSKAFRKQFNIAPTRLRFTEPETVDLKNEP